MTTENIEEKKFVLNKEEFIEYHNDLIQHPNVELLEKCIDGQRRLEKAARIRKLIEDVPANEEEKDVEQKEDGDGVKDGEKRTANV